MELKHEVSLILAIFILLCARHYILSGRYTSHSSCVSDSSHFNCEYKKCFQSQVSHPAHPLQKEGSDGEAVILLPPGVDITWQLEDRTKDTLVVDYSTKVQDALTADAMSG